MNIRVFLRLVMEACCCLCSFELYCSVTVGKSHKVQLQGGAFHAKSLSNVTYTVISITGKFHTRLPNYFTFTFVTLVHIIHLQVGRVTQQRHLIITRQGNKYLTIKYDQNT